MRQAEKFTVQLNLRLQEWVEVSNITGDIRLGLRIITIDHMFTLLALLQKQFSLNCKLYVAFIDFEKASDSVKQKTALACSFEKWNQGKIVSLH